MLFLGKGDDFFWIGSAIEHSFFDRHTDNKVLGEKGINVLIAGSAFDAAYPCNF